MKAAKLDNGWDSAGKTGTWQAGQSVTENLHTWMVGYTGPLAAAVWLGTVYGKPLKTKDGSYDVFGATGAAPIWRQFMEQATAALKLDPDKYRFAAPQFPQDASPSATPGPTTAKPTPSTAQTAPTTAKPTATTVKPTASTAGPSCNSTPCATVSPTATRTRTPRPSPSQSSGGTVLAAESTVATG